MSSFAGVRPAAAPQARALLDIFAATVAHWGDRPAIDTDEAGLTYRELAAAAGALAARLTAAGIGAGDRVAVHVPSGTSALYVAILGVLHSGAAYVPLDADDPPRRVADLLGRSGACAVVRDGLAVEHLARGRGAYRPRSLDDDAWIIFTSGSTGPPKAVAVSLRSAAAFVDAEARLWTVNPEDRVLAGLSVAFDASCEEMWLAWRHGAALVPAPRKLVRAGTELGPWLAERRVTVVSTVPTLAALWDATSLSGVRLVILGGEACPEPLAWRLAAEREVWNTYGPTEATVVTTAAAVRVGEPVSIGWPLDGWETAVVDEQGAPVLPGEAGELVIAGAGVARYLDPLLDTERFPPVPALGWERAYLTGDIVRETPAGLMFVGRRDEQVKIAGRRIELGEIDAQLRQIPGVTAAVTVIRESRAGNKLLVGYVVGERDPAEVRAALADRLPHGLVPAVVALDALPHRPSGKLDRDALPWPPPSGSDGAAGSLSPTARWLAECWIDQLGPIDVTLESDFFALGGSSLAAAKLISALRERFPRAAIADLYSHRRLGDLSARLEQLTAVQPTVAVAHAAPPRRWAAAQLAGVFALLASAVPQWLLGILALDNLYPGHLGPQVAWPWLIAGWLVCVSAPSRALILAASRRLLLGSLAPGRHPRHGWLACRIWFVERLSELFHLESLAGTPWAHRYARLSGHRVGPGARLGTLPPPTSLVHIGEGATLEPDVDLHGWWIDGQALVVGALHIGAGARVGTRCLLMPGATIGDGAEVEPGSVITGVVPAAERWSGSPAHHVGRAGDGWPHPLAPVSRPRLRMRAMYAGGLAVQAMLPLLASIPGVALLSLLAPAHWTPGSLAMAAAMLAPLVALSFVVAYALLTAMAVRALGAMVAPGWHRDDAPVAWALWLSESLMAGARGILFPLYASVYTRPWLRLAGIPVGRGTEISTAVGLNRLTRFGELSFAADDVVLAGARARGGWLHVDRIEVGDRSFLGNGAMLHAATTLGDDSLVGVLTTAPRTSAGGTSWFGSPALELPRVRDRADPARTTDPPARLVLARAAMELIRIVLPGSVSTVLGALVFWSLSAIGTASGIGAMILAAPALIAAAALGATLATIAIKWTLIGRYRAGEHPLWSFFVWRDEIVNSCQEQLAGAWLLSSALATPLMSLYLRLMGATVGRDVWCETLTVTEFDLAHLGDGCAVNRNAVVETHLFHDRLMRIGPATVAPGATLGPAAAMLPHTTIGAGCCVGGRSVVMSGERLPAHTRWHGSPVHAV